MKWWWPSIWLPWILWSGLKTDLCAWGPVVSSPHCIILLLYLVLRWIAHNSLFFTHSFLCLLACSGLSKIDPWKTHAYFQYPKRSLFSLLPWWCVWLAPGKCRSKNNFLQKFEDIVLFYAISQCCSWKAKLFWFLMFSIWPFFFFLPRIFSFPSLLNFTISFLCVCFHLLYWPIIVFFQSADTCFSAFLCRTPTILVLYFLDQSSNFLIFSISLSFCSLFGQFLQL